MITDRWTEQNNRLVKSFEFKDFKEAFAFISRVAAIADEMDHHPYWTNCWNKVYFELNTHSAGGIVTVKDELLAKAIDKAANE